MIGNVTVGQDFQGLASYLTRNTDRVAWSHTHNTLSDNAKEVAREMQLMAEQSTRCKKPVYHLSLSWTAQDAPSKEQMLQACTDVLEELELHEHQVLMIAHNDTSHPHVHLMINRIHMETGRAWSRSHDYRRIQHIAQKLEKKYGWHIVQNREQSPGQMSRNEYLAARRQKTTPFVDQIRARVGDQLSTACSWHALEQTLWAEHLHLQTVGGGLVVTDGTHQVALSRVNRAGGRKRLETLYGQSYATYREEGQACEEALHQELLVYQTTLEREAREKQIIQTYQETDRTLKHLQQKEKNRNVQSSRFWKQLQRVYTNPEQAWKTYTALARWEGAPVASDRMRQNPAAFGTLHRIRIRRWWGLKIVWDNDPGAYAGAQTAARYGRAFIEAAQEAPSAAQLQTLKQQVAGQEKELIQYRAKRWTLPSSSECLGKVGKHALRLPPPRLPSVIQKIGLRSLQQAITIASRMIQQEHHKDRGWGL